MDENVSPTDPYVQLEEQGYKSNPNAPLIRQKPFMMRAVSRGLRTFKPGHGITRNTSRKDLHEDASCLHKAWYNLIWPVVGHKLNWLLLVTPFTIAAKAADWPAGWVFLLNLIAMTPLAAGLGFLTEQLALHTNQTLGGLLNATFGNATEIIISIFAIQKGLLTIVRVSLLGSILSNLLLVLGSAIMLGGWKEKYQKFSKVMGTTSSGMLFLAVTNILLISTIAANGSYAHGSSGAVALSRFTSFGMLGAYIAYLIFQLKTHRDSFEDEDDEDEEKLLPFWGCLAWLTLYTVLIALFSEWLVGAIEGAAHSWGLSSLFIGTILIPIVGNAAEHATALTAAWKNKMDITLGVAVGSSTQIAMFALPFSVILAWWMGHDLTLVFTPFEAASVLASVILVSFTINEGSSNWLSGFILLLAYILIGAGFFVHTDGD